MQATSTVFVLGAGSSAEFGLVAGEGLASEICKNLKFWFEDFRMTGGDPIIYAQLKRFSHNDMQSYSAAAHVIARGLPYSRSIDDFLYNHSEDENVVLVGKVAVAKGILAAEANSSLSKLTSHDKKLNERILENLNETWLFRLFRFLQTDIKRSEIHTLFDGIEIINFNYDRCLEQFLYHAIQIAYSLDEATAAQVMKTLKIHRPYGRVGRLPWQDGSEPSVEFAKNAEEVDLIGLSKNVHTFTEQRSDEEFKDISTSSRSAARMVFLGFAFHKQNMKILDRGMNASGIPVYGTTYGTSIADEHVFKEMISESIFGGILRESVLVPAKCGEFVKEYGLRLSRPIGAKSAIR